MFSDSCILIVLSVIVIGDCQSPDWLKELRKIFRAGGGVIRDTEVFRKEYDFIVIGAGSGGSVVANRLTENPNWTVLLLEAGEEENFFTDVPLMAALQSVTAYNWNYHSQKLKTACLGLNYGRCSITRGKAVGGTSVLNFLIYTRGNRQDYDSWAAMGNEGWSYDEVLPYFIRSENCTVCSQIDEEYHGINGYLNIENPGYESPFVKLFMKAGRDMGYRNNDPNGGAEALAFVKTKLSTNSTDDYPDIELVLGAGALNGDVFGSFRKLLEIPDRLFQTVYGPIISKPAFGIALVLMRPKSRGRVMLKDSNPFHWPLIYPNYYERKEDIATMVEGIKMVSI
nr:unnamed protein product [Callosobruchus chinensis]